MKLKKTLDVEIVASRVFAVYRVYAFKLKNYLSDITRMRNPIFRELEMINIQYCGKNYAK